MSISLTQKVDDKFRGIARWILAMCVTDEIFAVAMSQEKPVSRRYFAGLALTPYLGWGFGTLAGALLGEIVPAQVAEIFGIAIYGMFLAIIIPKARDNRPVLKVVLLAAVLSCVIHYLPFIKLSSGTFGSRIVIPRFFSISFVSSEQLEIPVHGSSATKSALPQADQISRFVMS